jgi:hypothetical protein
MLETLAPILVALTAAALVIAGTRTPTSRRPDRHADAATRRRHRSSDPSSRDDAARFVAVRNAWDRADLARAIGTDNATPEINSAPPRARAAR